MTADAPAASVCEVEVEAKSSSEVNGLLRVNEVEAMESLHVKRWLGVKSSPDVKDLLRVNEAEAMSSLDVKGWLRVNGVEMKSSLETEG